MSGMKERRKEGREGRRTVGGKGRKINSITQLYTVALGWAILGKTLDDLTELGKEAWLWSHKDLSLNPGPPICSMCDANMSLNSEPQFAQL